MPTLPRVLLIACLLIPGAALVRAQAPAAAPTEAAPPATTGDAPAEATPAPAQAAPDGAADQRRLQAGGEEFGVSVAPITGGPAQGALVLIPGDGAFAMSSRGIAQLRSGMPAFGWSAWLPELESPPRVHAHALDGKEPAGAAPAEPAAEAPATATQGTPAAPAAQAAEKPAEEPAAAGVAAAAEAVPLEAARAAELQAWATRSRARLAAVVTAAAGEGRVVVVAEGVGAALLTGFVAEAPHAAFAVALIEPVELPGLPATWPKGSATPVLEVFDPAAQHTQGAARRSQANASGLHYYRQTVLSTDAGSAPEAETLLVRRLRGWLKSLEPQDAPPEER